MNIKNNILCAALTAAVSLSVMPVSAAVAEVLPTTSLIYINGELVNIDNCNTGDINSSNICDLSDILGFDVDLSESNRFIFVSANGECTLVPDNSDNDYVGDSGEYVPEQPDYSNNDYVGDSGEYVPEQPDYSDNDYVGDSGEYVPEQPDYSDNDHVGDSNNSGSISFSEYAEEVVRLVNIERAKSEIAPLTLDSELSKAADIRAKECNTKFSHTRPDGSSCFTVLDELGISYRACAENIAAGQQTPEDVVNSWMNSEGHRANIMNSAYTKIGVGVTASETYSHGYSWVQLFTD